jgi:HmuY protein
MKKTMKHSLVIAIAIVTVFTACSKTESITIDTSNKGTYRVFTQNNVTTVQNFVADTIQGYDPISGQPLGGSNKRFFFSLERGTAVLDTSIATWDLAFNSSKIWINGGNSGNKMGGAYNKPALFDNVLNAVDSLMKVDGATSPTSRAITGYDAAPNTASNNGWYTLTPPPPAASVIVPVPGRTILVRTASGKYAKVEIMCYYKGGTTPSAADAKAERYYNFRYTYQPNGTTTF